MTHTVNGIVIAAPPERIYAYAGATERWPEFLPHYRYVRVLDADGDTKLVEMAALRGWIPVRWRARQTNDPLTPSIHFTHVAGWTRGMEVEWRFEPDGDSTRVTIDHRLQFRFPVAAELIGTHVVGRFFIEYIATRTLRRMKALAEAPAS